MFRLFCREPFMLYETLEKVAVDPSLIAEILGKLIRDIHDLMCFPQEARFELCFTFLSPMLLLVYN